jgi:predicted NACHT family NTPase
MSLTLCNPYNFCPVLRSSLRKEDLLSQIALTTFNRKEYFFKQKELEQSIADYICNLPDAKTDAESLQFDSEVVLKSIEAQHGLLIERAKGIYSFSHLTFQEYFTARRIVTTSNPKNLEMALQDLSSHISEKRWREVFLLAVGMLPDADRLLQLMKQNIDKTVTSNEELQQFLTWVHQKSLEFKSLYRPEATRAFYLANALRTDHSSTTSLKKLLDQIVHYADEHAFAPQIIHTLKQAKGSILDLHLNYNNERSEQAHFFIAYTLDENLKFQCLLNSVEKLSEKLPSGKGEGRKFRDWWKINGKTWAKSFSTTVALHRSIDQRLQVSEQFQKAAYIYYEANKLLIECLDSDCYVSRKVRQEIEETLLLPTPKSD